MKKKEKVKIINIFFILILILTNNSIAEITLNCDDFNKLSAKYIECKAKKLKKNINDSNAKEKITNSAKNIKKKINESKTKKKFDKSTLKEKLIKLKNSKTGKDFLENQ